MKKTGKRQINCPCNTEEITCAYKSKYIIKRENQVILLMITDGKNGIILL